MKPLILLGGGGHCKSVIDVAESIGRQILGILDIPSEVGKKVLDYPVLGTDDQAYEYIGKCEFLITVGFIKNPDLRNTLYDKIKYMGGTFATLVAKTAYVSKHASVGEGTVVMHNAFINAGATIGNNVIINTFSNIEHDAIVGNNSHISTGAMINGGSIIGENCFIGSQSVIANGIKICDNAIVGAGSLVRKSIIRPGIYSGNPAILKIKR